MNLSEIGLSDDDKRAFQPVADRLDRLVAISVMDLVREAAYKPTPGSRAAVAYDQGLQDPYELAGQRLFSAEDHLRTLRFIVGPGHPLTSFAPFTLVRGAAVPALHARHLLDPAVDETTRFARALIARLVNLEQQNKVHADPVHFGKRKQHLIDRATTNGVAVIRDRTGNVLSFGERRCSDTELSAMYIPEVGQLFFQYVSGFAHGMPWAQLPIHRAVASADPKISLVPTDISVPVFASVLSGALDLYDRTIGCWLAHAGYPPDVWEQAKR